MSKKGPYRISLDKLSSQQKDAMLLHLGSLNDALVAANNELIKRLGTMPKPIVDIFDQWLGVCNDIQLASSKEVKLICGEAYQQPEGSLLQ